MATGARLLSLLLAMWVAIAQARHDDCGGGIPCGDGAVCTTSDDTKSCTCNEGLYGNPYVGCTDTPGCKVDEQCPDNQKCNSFNECEDPCMYDCPQDAGCVVVKHVAKCFFDDGKWW